MIYSFENALFRDKETGLYSEAYFMEMFHREWHRMIREHNALSVLVVHPNVDIMNPKGMEDYIHLARLIDGSTKRNTDLVSRFHNNEFIIGLFDLSIEGTDTIIQRMLNTIKQSTVENTIQVRSAYIAGLNVFPSRELDIVDVLQQVEAMTSYSARQQHADKHYELRTIQEQELVH